ncbi:hypothetical protein ACWKW4_19310, partial [Hydrogenophaga borbori]
MAEPAAPTPPKALSAPQKAMHKLGLKRDIDLALHLPLRYEDETRVVALREAREGSVVQIEGTVTHSEVQYRGRRQLLVTLDDGSDTCTLRFFSFYPSHQKTLAVGGARPPPPPQTQRPERRHKNHNPPQDIAATEDT